MIRLSDFFISLASVSGHTLEQYNFAINLKPKPRQCKIDHLEEGFLSVLSGLINLAKNSSQSSQVQKNQLKVVEYMRACDQQPLKKLLYKGSFIEHSFSFLILGVDGECLKGWRHMKRAG